MATKTVNVAITAEDKTNAAFASVKERLTGLQTAVAGFKKSITGGLISTYAILQSIRALESLGRAVYNNTVVWQGMEYTLQAAGLSSAETNAQLKFLEDTSLQLGLNIKDVSNAFSRFILTGKAAGVSLTDLDDQFKAVSEAMRIFHLTNNQTTRSWLALTEVMSMGTLHSRQFTQQLGRDWPGIGALIAGALYPGENSLARFQKAMMAGQISSEKFMQGFQKVMAEPAMQGALNNAIDSIQAAMGRFQTTLFNFFNEADNPEALDSLKNGLNSLSATLNDPSVKRGFDNVIGGLIKLTEWAAKATSAIGEAGDYWGQLFAKWSTGIDLSGDRMSQLKDNIQQVKITIAHLQDAIANNTAMFDLGISAKEATRQLKAAQMELTMLQKGLAGLQSGKAGVDGSIVPASNSGSKAAAPPLEIGTPEEIKAMHDYDNMWSMLNKTQAENAPIAAEVNANVIKIKDAMAGIDTTHPFEKMKIEMQGVSQFAIQAQNNIESATAKMFESIGQNGATLKSILHSLFVSMEADAANMLAKLMIEKAIGSAANSSTSWIAAIGNMFTGTSSVSVSGGRAGGGPVSGGSTYLVGEQGPELFAPGISGTIIPNHALQGQGAGHTINIDARGAGPDEVARLEGMRREIMDTMRTHTELRLQRNAWPTNRR